MAQCLARFVNCSSPFISYSGVFAFLAYYSDAKIQINTSPHTLHATDGVSKWTLEISEVFFFDTKCEFGWDAGLVMADSKWVGWVAMVLLNTGPTLSLSRTISNTSTQIFQYRVILSKYEHVCSLMSMFLWANIILHHKKIFHFLWTLGSDIL